MSKIKVCELARRLTSIGTEMTPLSVVAMAEAAGVPVSVSGSLDDSQVFVMLGQTDLPRRKLVPQLMALEWPPPQPRSQRIDVAAPDPIRIVPRDPCQGTGRSPVRRSWVVPVGGQQKSMLVVR